MNRSEILQAIDTECNRQVSKWGDQKHNVGRWFLILTEELGEASKAALEYSDYEGLVTELVQSAAVLVAMIEDITRHD